MVFIPAALAEGAVVETIGGATILAITPEVIAALGRVGVGVVITEAGGVATGAVVTAGNTIGAGQLFAIVAAASGTTEIMGNITSVVSDWVKQEMDPNDLEHVTKVAKEAVFAGFTVKAGTFVATDLFEHKYPVDPSGAILQQRFLNNTPKADGARALKARIIGFWAVRVKIKSYEPAKLSGWRHSLDRRNFGSLAFCYEDVVIQESQIHFSLQIIPIPMVRALVAQYSMGDLATAVCNKIHGSLAPGVTAEISFIPVYECVGWTWTNPKAPP
jgi:hypothetical protein